MVKGYQTKLTKRKDGTWENYKRATLDDVEDFVGWEIILRLLLAALRTIYYRRSTPNIPDHAREELRYGLQFRDISLEVIAMLTGGRISETLMLHAGNFTEQSNRIVVRNMPLLKRYTVHREEIARSLSPPDELEPGHQYRWDKDEKSFIIERVYTTPRIVKRRNFPIPKWERPLVDILQLRIAWANQQEGEYKWLFPTPKLPVRVESPGVQKWIEDEFGLEVRAWISPQRAYQVVRRLGERVKLRETAHIWNHWWRIMRASQLGVDYEFEDAHLNAFFGWTGGLIARSSMAGRYSRTGIRRIWRRMSEGKEEVELELSAAMEAVKWKRKTRKFFRLWEELQ